MKDKNIETIVLLKHFLTGKNMPSQGNNSNDCLIA